MTNGVPTARRRAQPKPSRDRKERLRESLNYPGQCTRFHKVVGYRQPVYRADIDKISGWRIHVQYEGGQIHLKDVIEGQRHDDVLDQIDAKKIRYERKPPGSLR